MKVAVGDMRDISGLLYRYDGVSWEWVWPISGQPCPTCGRRVPMTGAERQRKYRERQKLLKDLFGDKVRRPDDTG